MYDKARFICNLNSSLIEQSNLPIVVMPRTFLVAVEEVPMMLLMISTVLASLAMGVTIAYALCSLLFLLFRTHVRAHRTVPLRIHAKTAQL